MRKLINMLKKNDNAYSVGRICAVIGLCCLGAGDFVAGVFCPHLGQLRKLHAGHGSAAVGSVGEQGD